MSQVGNVGMNGMDPWAAGIGAGLNDLFTPLLGPLAVQENINPHEIRPMDKFDLPEAYNGRNLFLRDTLNDWLFTATQTWYTSRVAPWIITEELHVVWSEWEANAHFMGMTPEQTTSRLITQEHNIRRASLTRRGIAMEFESGFVKTSMGRRSFFAGIGQMARSASETIHAEIIRSLVNSYKFQNKFQREAGVIRQNELEKLLKRDRDRFALVQKVKNGLVKADADINAEMLIYGGVANAWIMTEDVSIYQTFVRSEVTDYQIAGPMGPARINGEPLGSQLASANTNGTLDRIEPMHMLKNNTPVFIARSFVGSNQGETLDLLTRTRQVGEYNVMFDENTDWLNYKSASRDIAIYNQNEDKFNKISLASALLNCGRFNPSSGEAVGPKRDTRGDVTEHEYDLDQDFLTFGDVDNKRVTAKYIGDISYEFLGPDLLRNAGRTIRNALVQRYGATLDDAIIEVENEMRTPTTADKVVTQPENLDNFTKVATAMSSVLGMDNLFFKPLADDEIPESSKGVTGKATTPGQRLWRVLVAKGLVPVIQKDEELGKLPVQSNIGAAAGSGGGSRLDAAFLASLRAAVPDSQRPMIQSIIDQPGASVLERGSQIRDAAFDMVTGKLAGLRWNNHAAVKAWYDNQVTEYKSRATPVEAEVPAAAKKQTPPKIGWALPGQQLPAGWRYMYSASAHRAPPGGGIAGDIPNCAAALNFVGIDIDAYASQRTQPSTSGFREMGSDSGMGLMGRVGAMADFSTPEGVAKMRARRVAGEAPFGQSEPRFKNLGNLLQKVNECNLSTFEKILSMAYLGCSMKSTTMMGLIDSDIILPMGFLLFRPHCQVRTRIAIKVQEGGGCINSVFGHPDLQIQSEAGRKIGLIHYTAYMGAIVHSPKNVYVLPDVLVHDYQGGMGCEFWSPDTYRIRNTHSSNVDRDIICVAVPYTERKMPNPLDISGRFYTEYKAGLLTREKYEPLHYTTAFFVNQMYAFHDAAARRRGADEPNMQAGKAHVNRICWQGCQFSFNPRTSDFSRVRPNTGHWGPTYQGVAAIREGSKNEQMVEPDYGQYAVM